MLGWRKVLMCSCCSTAGLCIISIAFQPPPRGHSEGVSSGFRKPLSEKKLKIYIFIRPLTITVQQLQVPYNDCHCICIIIKDIAYSTGCFEYTGNPLLKFLATPLPLPSPLQVICLCRTCRWNSPVLCILSIQRIFSW